jgi:hypothetical protein
MDIGKDTGWGDYSQALPEKGRAPRQRRSARENRDRPVAVPFFQGYGAQRPSTRTSSSLKKSSLAPYPLAIRKRILVLLAL